MYSSYSGRLGIMSALAAAALFGASTPLAKLLVGAVPPVLLAGVLYLGSGIGRRSGTDRGPQGIGGGAR